MVKNTTLSSKRMSSFWQRSRCLGIWLHRFKIVKQWDEAVMERCEICHKSKVFQIRNGRVNNNEYIAWHIRQMLVPNHNLFSHEYEKSK